MKQQQQHQSSHRKSLFSAEKKQFLLKTGVKKGGAKLYYNAVNTYNFIINILHMCCDLVFSFRLSVLHLKIPKNGIGLLLAERMFFDFPKIFNYQLFNQNQLNYSIDKYFILCNLYLRCRIGNVFLTHNASINSKNKINKKNLL